jgi:CheY-like chemotaxis protein
LRTLSEASAVAHSVPKILVVDDDPNITRALWRRFRAVGIETIRSHHAMEGMFLAIKEQPDVIITDYKMPEMSGDRLLMKLKYIEETKDIPVIVLTGVTIEGKQDLALKREMLGRGGAVSYFNKPLDFDALLDELRRHIVLPKVLPADLG